jgi:hypothetical protein
MPGVSDGPRTSLFSPVAIQGNVALSAMKAPRVGPPMADAAAHAASGECTGQGASISTRR